MRIIHARQPFMQPAPFGAIIPEPWPFLPASCSSIMLTRFTGPTLVSCVVSTDLLGSHSLFPCTAQAQAQTDPALESTTDSRYTRESTG